MRTRFRLALDSALLALASAAGLLFSSAARADVIDRDYFKITERHADFGDGTLNEVLGTPGQNGRLDWHDTNGVLRPYLSGKVWINNTPNGCVRMQLQYFYSAGSVTYSDTTWCAPNDNRTYYAYVDFDPFSNSTITSVCVILQFHESGDPWSSVGTRCFVPS
jgi:hypothetical protein